MADPRDLFDLTGRVALVTGASSGLGRQAATVLAAAGARVAVVARRAAQLDRWVQDTPGDHAALALDVTQPDAVSDLPARLVQSVGAPDIVVHAAGLNLRQPANEVTAAGWEATVAVNLTAPFFLSQALVPAMRAKGWGRIVNFASLQTTRAFPGGIAYGTTKGGVAQMTRAMAEAWSAHGVTANAIGPGFFPTELTAPVFEDPERAARNASQTCIGRNGRLEDIDGPLLFLCSPASDYVTGQILMVDGGFTAK